MRRTTLLSLAGIAILGGALVAQTQPAAPAAVANPAPAGAGAGRAGGAGGGTGRGGAAAPAANALVAPLLAQGDRNADGALDRDEVAAVATAWFEALDSEKTGRINQADFISRLPGVLTANQAAAAAAPAGGGAAGRGGRGGGGASPALGLFLSGDVNADGALTRTEFTNFFTKWFSVWDTAGNGSLTPEALSTGLNNTLPAAGAETLDFAKRPAVQAQTADEQQKLFQLPPGYKIELVLSDPDIQDPVSVSFDGNGRMYVLEMRSYMRDANGSNSREPIGRISRWEDTDGDGKYDKHTVFADKLVLPRIAHPLGSNSVLVIETDTYDLMKFTDTDGDGVADKKELFFAGFGRVTNMEWQPGGSLVWALDNWMYSSYNPFRIRLTPQGKVIREETAVNGGQWSAAQDNYGKVWFVDGGGEIGPVNFQQPIIYGAFNVADNFEPGFETPWGAALGLGDMQGGMGRVRLPDGSLNHLTAAAGPGIFRGTRLPADAVGDLFFSDPVGRIVRRAKIVVTDGVTQLQNAYPRSEFIRSTDPVFRPVNVQNAPDGSLFVSDMYTGMIQDAQWTNEGSYLRRRIEQHGLEKIFNHGRIWRVVHESAPAHSTQPRMLQETPAQLVAHLTDPSGWWRDTAQELLVLKQDKSVVPALTAMLRADHPLARIHALWTLEGLESLTPALVREALRSPDAQLRIQALRASETLYKAGDKSFANDYRTLAKDTDPNVVIQALLSSNLMQIPDNLALIRTTREASSSRGVKDIGGQLLVPGASMGQPTQSGTGNDPFMGLPTEQRRLMNQGQAIYRELCTTCHGPDGKGMPMAGSQPPAMLAPPLSGSSRVTGHRDYVINVLLKGLSGEIEGQTYSGGAVMVPMGSNTDEWIAAIASYVRNTFGNTGSYVAAPQVAALRTATAGRTASWTLAELEPTIPRPLTNQAEWKLTASDNAAAAMNPVAPAPAAAVAPVALPAGAPTAAATPAVLPGAVPAAAAPRGAGAGGGRGAAAPAAPRWDTVTAQRANMWFQVELPNEANVTEVQLDSAAAGGRGGGRGAAQVAGPLEYRVQVSSDGITWSAPVATGTGEPSTTTTIAFRPVRTKFIRITQTAAETNAPIWAIQRLRVYNLP